MEQATVHLVPTLHQYHAAAPGYGFDALTRVLEGIRPQVLVVQLSAPALRARRPQRVKQEYQHCVFPFLERHGLPAVAMEPGEPLFSELVGQGLEAQRQFEALAPEAYAEWQRSAGESFRALLRSWKSPAAVDSEHTDVILQARHAREGELFGAESRDAWDRYNEHFAQAIASTARAHPGRRIVALAGVEHGWWLRPRLQALAGASGAWRLAPRLGERGKARA